MSTLTESPGKRSIFPGDGFVAEQPVGHLEFKKSMGSGLLASALGSIRAGASVIVAIVFEGGEP
jgi:hypothetical protein